MPDIKQSLFINASVGKVFNMVSDPKGLDIWWTKSSSGIPDVGELNSLYFGPGYDWRAKVIGCSPNQSFELKLVEAEEIWKGTIVGFKMSNSTNGTNLKFYHTGWKEEVENFPVSSYCWAMYLRILKRYLEYGEIVQYKDRLDV